MSCSDSIKQDHGTPKTCKQCGGCHHADSSKQKQYPKTYAINTSQIKMRYITSP